MYHDSSPENQDFYERLSLVAFIGLVCLGIITGSLGMVVLGLVLAGGYWYYLHKNRQH